MPNLSLKYLQACRRLMLLSVGLYVFSFVILAGSLGSVGKPLVWLPYLPYLFLFWAFDFACLANLTLAWGWHCLHSGRAIRAFSLGVVSVGLAAMYWLDPLNIIDSVMPVVVACYFGWVGSMVVLIAAALTVPDDRERDEPPK
ncbi:MAG TPA: hypothetical protein VD866_14615 [Urbifossiella sp.]|nr:hypothetical protein [Urbifossiella sp.]